jgi:coproporphyrinogen III oxidase-like Fe-S oxidoreductase
MVEKIHLSSVQGTVLASLGSGAGFVETAKYVDISVGNEEIGQGIQQLVDRGYLQRTINGFELTEEGRRAGSAFIATLIAES